MKVIVPPFEREMYDATGSRVSFSTVLMAVVTKTWSPQTTGELQDRPGTSIFQTMFCVGPHASGNDGWSAATPPSAPRNRGQLSSAEATAEPIATPQSARKDTGCDFRPYREEITPGV